MSASSLAMEQRPNGSEPLGEQDIALLRLGQLLRQSGYRFTTPTPATHALVNARRGDAPANSLGDVFGWSRAFDIELLPAPIADLARQANVLERSARGWRSAVRFSSLGPSLFAHSAFPTTTPDAVFFGPDTYRFARLLSAVSVNWNLPSRPRIVDVGAGSGAGGIHLGRLLERRCEVELVLGDINPQALRLARVNAQLNACPANVIESDVLSGVEGEVDVVIANPPYLVDAAKRTYRHGGGAFGGGLSERIVEEALTRLRPGGRLALYTGSAIVEGVDTLSRALEPVLKRSGRAFSYEELDPDVFGEELKEGPYAAADRIALVAVLVG
jgi:methylase of polypeptide subunit release factors